MDPNLKYLMASYNQIKSISNLPPKLKKSNIKYTKPNDDDNCLGSTITFFKQTYKRFNLKHK